MYFKVHLSILHLKVYLSVLRKQYESDLSDLLLIFYCIIISKDRQTDR